MIRIETARRRKPEIGIAPMIDCVLLLLIFFLLTSSFAGSRAIKLDLPRSSTARNMETQNIEIVVSEVGAITLQGQRTTISDLAATLRNVVARQGKHPVLLKADRRLSLGEVSRVIDCIRTAGLETVSIATDRASPAQTQGQDE